MGPGSRHSEDRTEEEEGEEREEQEERGDRPPTPEGGEGKDQSPNTVTPIKSWLKKHLDSVKPALPPSKPVYIIPQVNNNNNINNNSNQTCGITRVAEVISVSC